MQTKHLFVLIHYIINGEVGTVKLFKPLSNFLTDRSKVVFLLCLLFVFVFANTGCLFVAALWSPVGEELTSWLSCM